MRVILFWSMNASEIIFVGPTLSVLLVQYVVFWFVIILSISYENKNGGLRPQAKQFLFVNAESVPTVS